MERKRQVPQDLNRMHGERIRLAEKSIGIYAVQNVLREIEVPSRVEGRTVKLTREVPTMVQTAEYPDVATYLHERAMLFTEQTPTSEWSLADIPAEVHAACDTYIADVEQQFTDFDEVVNETSQQPIDRMAATHVCTNCRGVDTYACHTCGTARKLYTYPLMRLRDAATGKVYDVPFDIALYLQEHPTDEGLAVRKTVNYEGQLEAKYALAYTPTRLTRQYVVRATNGAVVPSEAGLEYADGTQYRNARIELANWSERPYYIKNNSHITNSQQLLDTMQKRIAATYAERVEDVDYNAKLQTIQRTLGAHGLSLFYHWRAGGMGDWDVIYSARGKGDIHVKDAYSGDAYDALLKFEQNMNAALPSA